MTEKEAIRRIKVHTQIHFVKEKGRCPLITEALYMAIIALEKQMPKKPIEIINDNECQIGARIIPKGTVAQKCPVCDSFTSRSCNYCQKCGQALDWSDNE